MNYKMYYVVHRMPIVLLNIEIYDNIFIYDFTWSHE